MRIKPLRLALVAVIVAALTLTGCASNNGGTSNSSDGANGKIALAMSHMSNEFTTTVAKAAQEAGKKAGYEVVVFDAKQDASTQVSQIEQAASQGFKGILVEPVSTDGVMPGIIAANDAGIPIATIVQKASDQSKAKTYIGGDEVKAGNLQMTEAVKALGGKGKIAVLYGPLGSDAQLARKKGYDEVLGSNSGVSVAFAEPADWETAKALTQVENWLSTGTDLVGVVAQNDGMAVGAVQAIANAGKTGKIQVFGIDATADGISAIESGGMVGTVSQDTAGIGRLGVETMVKIIEGQSVPKEVLTTAKWITKDNVGSLG